MVPELLLPALSEPSLPTMLVPGLLLLLPLLLLLQALWLGLERTPWDKEPNSSSSHTWSLLKTGRLWADGKTRDPGSGCLGMGSSPGVSKLLFLSIGMCEACVCVCLCEKVPLSLIVTAHIN